MTDLNDYYDLLLNHDWFYDFSDDHSVYKRGLTNLSKLRSIAEESPEHKNLFDKFNDHYFSGPAWDTEKQPLPERPRES